MNVLGISAFYHDSAAAIVSDGNVVNAAQEERFTRKKHDASFPTMAVQWCLRDAKLAGKDIDYVAFYDKPFLKFERLLETYVAFAPRGFTSFLKSMPVWLGEKLFQKHLLQQELHAIDTGLGKPEKMLFAEHHFSHAASAYFPSPFQEAAVLTMDGVGEWTTTSVGHGNGKNLELKKEIHFPHSLGLLYSAFTYYCGFKVNSGEYKLMGLAPYGVPRYAPLILDRLIDIKDDGSFRLDLRYFDYCTGLTMVNRRFDELFDGRPRRPEEPITQRDMDLAASIQAVTEEVVLRMTRALARESGSKNLCIAGGVALNCVANGKVLRDNQFRELWIQPASGDSGGAVGAALAATHQHCNLDRPTTLHGRDGMRGAFLGPSFDQTEIEEQLSKVGAQFETVSESSLIEMVARAMSDEKVVGWFQGRMEYGPRALGGRSIIADPRSPAMQRTLNLKIKYRESFRPFAPSVLREDLSEWFDLAVDSPYMLLVADVGKDKRLPAAGIEEQLFGIEKLNVVRSKIPAVTHVDHSSRIQTVHADTNRVYYELIKRFKELTGCPVVVNTSFNIRGEPIVCTPQDAFRCFMSSEMDVLAVGNCILFKDGQKPELRIDYKELLELD